MRKPILFLFLLTLAFASGLELAAQSIIDQIKYKNREIEALDSLISGLKAQKEAGIESIRVLYHAIGKKERSIGENDSLLKSLDQSIGEIKSEIDKLEFVIHQQKEEYSRAVYSESKHNSKFSVYESVFMSNSIAQFLEKLYVIRSINANRKERLLDLKRRMLTLQSKKDLYDDLVAFHKATKKDLDADMSSLAEQAREVTRLVLSSNFEKQQLNKRMRQINYSIDSLKKSVVEQSAPSATASKSLTSHFFLRKGKLPWPVERGIVVKRHGVPSVGGGQPLSYGIEISTEKGGMATSVANGQVVAVSRTHELAGVAIVKHDSFYTFYSNLDRISVLTGQKVEAGSRIGFIKTSNLGYTLLHFEVWEEHTIDGRPSLVKLNPEHWLRSGF